MTQRTEGRVAAQWRSYREAVVPADAGPAQLQGTELAFYGGASAMLSVLVNVLGPGAEVTDADLAVMDDIAKELREHARALVASCPHTELDVNVCRACGVLVFPVPHPTESAE